MRSERASAASPGFLRSALICAAVLAASVAGLVAPAGAGVSAPEEFSPDVDLRMRGTTLTITGDNGDNYVEICGEGTTVVVTFVSLVDFGVPQEFDTTTFTGVRDTRALLGRGDDVLRVDCDIFPSEEGNAFDRDLVLNLGLGDDDLLGRGVTVGDDLTIVMGNGEDLTELIGFDVEDDLLYRGNGGYDRLRLTSGFVGDRLDINGGSGNSDIRASGVDIGRTLIRGGNNEDTIDLDGNFGTNARILTAAGEDHVSLFGFDGNGTLLVSTGNHRDLLFLPIQEPNGLAYNILQGGGDDFLGLAAESQAGDRFNGGPGDDAAGIDGESVTEFGDGTFISYETFEVGEL